VKRVTVEQEPVKEDCEQKILQERSGGTDLMEDATIVRGDIALVEEKAFLHCPNVSLRRLESRDLAYVS
jgi:hypothetical protein